jgi:opacity protein-like surface antigen
MKKITIILFLLGIGLSTVSLYSQDRTYLSNRIMLEGIYKRNLGHFSDIWSSATGGFIGYGIAFPEHNLLIIRSGVIVNNLKDGVDYKDASSTIIPLQIGGRYYFTDDRFMPFFTFMNGLNLVFENTNLEGVQEDRTLVKYAWELGFGLSASVVSNLIFDFSVNYNSHFYTTEAMMTGFTYNFGFAWALSK